MQELLILRADESTLKAEIIVFTQLDIQITFPDHRRQTQSDGKNSFAPKALVNSKLV
jgi:hypothetical protein